MQSGRLPSETHFSPSIPLGGGDYMTAQEETTLSIVMALHREGPLLLPTLASYDDACGELLAAGYSVDFIITFDRSDSHTITIFQDYIFRHIRSIQTYKCDFGDLGRARNYGISKSSAGFVATADGDDLISPDYLVRSLQAAQNHRGLAVFMPEYLFSFGDSYAINKYHTNAFPSSLEYFSHNVGVSRILCHRDLFTMIKYHGKELNNACYAWEDWHFTCECISNDIPIIFVPEIVLFYRRRPDSNTRRFSDAKLDHIAPSHLFEPSTYLRLAHPRMQPNQTSPRTVGRSFLELFTESQNIRDAFVACNSHEAQINPMSYYDMIITNVIPQVTQSSLAYEAVCEYLAGTAFSDVFFLPFLDRSGGSKYLSSIMSSIYSLQSSAPILVIIGEPYASEPAMDLLPPNSIVLDCNILMEMVDTSARNHIIIKILQHIVPNARLHMTTSSFAVELVRAYPSFIRSRKSVLYCFSTVYHIIADNLYEHGSISAFIRDFASSFTHIVYDNHTLLRHHSKILDLHSVSASVIYTRVTPFNQPILNRASLNPHQSGAFTYLLWASRPAPEKRPELLGELARRLLESHPDVRICVYGGNSNNFSTFLKKPFPHNLQFMGPYATFSDCFSQHYTAFLYTSLHDGIPNVILEAMSAGLPVLAPNVGGISEIVHDRVSGLLVSHDSNLTAMATSYLDKLSLLLADHTLTASITRTALNLVVTDFSSEAQLLSVQALLARLDIDYHN